MAKFGWMIVTFGAMYVVATIVGFGTYLLISPLAMWISVFTLMPMVSAILVRWYLVRMRVDAETVSQESLLLVGTWIALSFGFDAAIYILVVPGVNHTSPNWSFFVDQSPWIWLSYLALVGAGYAGRWMYLRRLQ